MIRKLLRSEMERKSKDITDVELASEIGTSPSNITRFFNYEIELTFPYILRAIRHLAPDREDILIKKVIDYIIKENHWLSIRCAMEYASTNRKLSLLKVILDSQNNSPKENKDWAKVYQLVLDFQARNIKNAELIKLIDQQKPKFLETRVLLSILKTNALYMNKEYKYMFRLAKEVEKEIETIKNVYIRESYTIRLCETFAQGYLFAKNDTKKARYYAQNVLNSNLCAEFALHASNIMGTSFLFEDYNTSIKYFEYYKKLLQKYGRKEIADKVEKNSIFFAKVLWGNDLENVKTDDVAELAHYEARWGNKELSVELVKKYEENNKECPYALCYKGIATQNPDMLLESMLKFINDGNMFMANLPKNELSKYSNYKNTTDILFKTIKIA